MTTGLQNKCQTGKRWDRVSQTVLGCNAAVSQKHCAQPFMACTACEDDDQGVTPATSLSKLWSAETHHCISV